MAKMTKSEFEEYFRQEVLPHVVERYEQDGIPDKPARREAWNDTVDAYIRDRSLPEAAGNWSHPRWLETLRPPMSAGRRHATKKADAGPKHWKVRFTRRGMEPPRPFGKTSVVVCAESREAAKEMVPASPNYPVTASQTTDPASFTYHCRHKAREEAAGAEQDDQGSSHARKKSSAQLDREIAEALNGHARKKTLDPREAKRLLQSDGIDFSQDFHALPSYEVMRLADMAKMTGYRKRKDAPGSTARMYYQYLSRLT